MDTQTQATQAPAPHVAAGAIDVVSRLVHVSKVYGTHDTRVVALNDVSVSIARGEFVAIMGPSGCGKSTFLHCAAALDSVSSGFVEIAGRSITGLPDKELTKLRRRMIGFIFQNYNLIPTLTAEQNILLPYKIGGLKIKQSSAKQFFNDLVNVLGLGQRLKHLPSQLSGGQQQRVAVARALMTRPEIIFADEPSGNLDSKAGAALLNFLKEANEAYRQTMVIVTHSPFIASFAKRIIFLVDGRVAEDTTQTSVAAINRRLQSLEEAGQ